MLTTMKPSTMNPKYPHSHAGFASVRISASPAPTSQLRYRQSPVVKRGFRGTFDWRPHPGLF
ncbi:hypothetical protein [Vitiosangium sp. GDMCC 1.1324]|uniref:hypothetical protein n=1 Tax=Vitiosangium sp. (strain GDMCC 1.1324) TaxID=2138576 RepID=UPI000D33616E|nr:hypothetical protein [Vitiosangium sp. GDMCC 1.1324]PTL79436.1 hypothetical protein DAT35_35185 [Vitiosangium sp. GDMCC 1.1324]